MEFLSKYRILESKQIHAITKSHKVTELGIYRKIFNIVDFCRCKNYQEIQCYELFYLKLLYIEEKQTWKHFHIQGSSDLSFDLYTENTLKILKKVLKETKCLKTLSPLFFL